jgi:hypothetical protein
MLRSWGPCDRLTRIDLDCGDLELPRHVSDGEWRSPNRTGPQLRRNLPWNWIAQALPLPPPSSKSFMQGTCVNRCRVEQFRPRERAAPILCSRCRDQVPPRDSSYLERKCEFEHVPCARSESIPTAATLQLQCNRSLSAQHQSYVHGSESWPVRRAKSPTGLCNDRRRFFGRGD